MVEKKEEITYNIEKIESAIRIGKELGWDEVKLHLSSVPLIEKQRKIKAPIIVITGDDDYSGIFICPIVRKLKKF